MGLSFIEGNEAIAYGDGLGVMSSLWGMGFKLEN